MAYLVTVVRPRSKLHETFLLIERKVLDIDLTGALVDSRRIPDNSPIVVNDRLGVQDDYFVVAVSTVSQVEPMCNDVKLKLKQIRN